VVLWDGWEEKSEKNMLQHDSIDGIKAIGVNTHQVTTNAYQ
jgi:hypothetical protein